METVDSVIRKYAQSHEQRLHRRENLKSYVKCSHHIVESPFETE
jgi:hypothetical protein